MLLFSIAGVALIAGQTAATADTSPQPVDNMHNVQSAPAPDSSAQFGTAPKPRAGVPICTTATSTAANVNTNCEATAGPHNETSIAVNPTNPLNMIGGANDTAFPHASAFIGDYSGIAATSDGGVIALWTDMTQPATFNNVTRSGEYAFFAKSA